MLCPNYMPFSTQALATTHLHLALCDVFLCYECSHNSSNASAKLGQVPRTHGAPTHRPTSSSALLNRAALPPSPICACKHITVPLVGHTASAHTNKGIYSALALRWYRSIPVYIPRRRCSRNRYVYTRARVIAKQLDVNVTSPHRERT